MTHDERISLAMATHFDERQLDRVTANIERAIRSANARSLWVTFRPDRDAGVILSIAGDQGSQMIRRVALRAEQDGVNPERKLRRKDVAQLSAIHPEVAAYLILHTQLDPHAVMDLRRQIGTRKVHPSSYGELIGCGIEEIRRVAVRDAELHFSDQNHQSALDHDELMLVTDGKGLPEPKQDAALPQFMHGSANPWVDVMRRYGIRL